MSCVNKVVKKIFYFVANAITSHCAIGVLLEEYCWNGASIETEEAYMKYYYMFEKLKYNCNTEGIKEG